MGNGKVRQEDHAALRGDLALAADRRRRLGIPVHESEEDHDWTSDGYCNCGAEKKSAKGPKPPRRHAGKVNLDVIERNSEANF